MEFLTLPDGTVLPDAVIWPDFMQTELSISPDAVWEQLNAVPFWPADAPIPYRPDGDGVHWIPGSHPALNYRGNQLPRSNIWLQDDYHTGLRRYGYTGWQHRVNYATHDIRFAPPAMRDVTAALNAKLAVPFNHWICTLYPSAQDNIGFHSDKDKDFAPDSWFVVLKLGARGTKW